MPFAEADLKTWIESLGLPEADKAAMLSSLSKPDVLTKVGSSILTQSEFSRKMNELKTKETQLEKDYNDRVAAEDRFKESLVGWKTKTQQELEAKAKAETDAAAAKLVAARDKIKALANSHGIPDDEIKGIIDESAAPPASATVPPRHDDGKFMTREDFKKEAEFYARLPAITTNLNTEYYRLFGNDAPMPNWDTVIETAKKTGKTLTDTFISTYKIDEKRKENADIARKKELEDAVKAAVESERSKIYAEHPELTGTRTGGQRTEHSPVLVLAADHVRNGPPKPGEVKDPMRGAKAAAAAWNDGKYREAS